jgi:protein-S-isoprenylcysteine O-methyltransferase Ste14
MNLVRKRIVISRIFLVITFLIYMFTTHSWSSDAIIGIIFEFSGLILIVIGTYGRIWSFVYICGRKTNELVTQGPYSVTRNPLYLFSFIGAAGLGLASENVAVLAVVLFAFLFFYPFVIRHEESELERVHGEDFRRYAATVPRFIPRTLSIKEPEIYEIYSRKFRSVFFDAMWFFWFYIIFQIVEKLQQSGIIPVLWKIP